MSRSYCSYDEEWQRRKSVLIRSLFHDIPILSPVEEESNSSSQDYFPTQEVFPSPPRPYSPLPPLIIERIPVINKHDEPEEHYMKLHKKIKRIYLKLFIEKRNISSVDYDSNNSERSINDDNLTNSDGSDSVENLDSRFVESILPGNGTLHSIVEDRDVASLSSTRIQSSVSTKSNEYGADVESMDTAIIDVINYTTSNEDAIMISEEEESNSEHFDNEGTKTIERKTSSRKRIDDPFSSEEQNSRDPTIDDQEMSESGQSNETEVEQSLEEEESNTENTDEHEINETNQNGEADRVTEDNLEISGGEESFQNYPHHSRISEKVRADSQESSEPEKDQQSVNIAKTDSDPKSMGGEKSISEGEKELIESNVEPMEEDEESSSSSEGPDYRQITIEALVHFDGNQEFEDRESRVYEDSVKSVILPTRIRKVVNRNDDDKIEVLAVLEEKDDPTTAPISDIDEDGTTDENLEEETTPLPDVTEKGHEKMITSQDAIDQDTGAMQTSIPRINELEIDAPEDVEDRSHHQDFIEKDLDAITTYQSDATHTEIRTHHQEAVEKKIEAMRTLQQTFTEKYTEQIKTYQSVATGKEIERTPQLTIMEKDFEITRITKPETIEDRRTADPQAANAKTISHQPETIMEEDEEQSDEEMESPHPIEVMRTPRPDFSHGTIPITHESNSGSTSEHTACPQEATAMTSSFQDDVNNDVSEIQTSNDMNEILTSIFNESRSKDEAPVSGKKRKLVDKSVQAVQTRRVTWDEMRTNFFVATPKIFRLCACTDHVCY